MQKKTFLLPTFSFVLIFLFSSLILMAANESHHTKLNRSEKALNLDSVQKESFFYRQKQLNYLSSIVNPEPYVTWIYKDNKDKIGSSRIIARSPPNKTVDLSKNLYQIFPKLKLEGLIFVKYSLKEKTLEIKFSPAFPSDYVFKYAFEDLKMKLVFKKPNSNIIKLRADFKSEKIDLSLGGMKTIHILDSFLQIENKNLNTEATLTIMPDDLKDNWFSGLKKALTWAGSDSDNEVNLLSWVKKSRLDVKIDSTHLYIGDLIEFNYVLADFTSTELPKKKDSKDIIEQQKKRPTFPFNKSREKG